MATLTLTSTDSSVTMTITGFNSDYLGAAFYSDIIPGINDYNPLKEGSQHYEEADSKLVWEELALVHTFEGLNPNTTYTVFYSVVNPFDTSSWASTGSATITTKKSRQLYTTIVHYYDDKGVNGRLLDAYTKTFLLYDDTEDYFFSDGAKWYIRFYDSGLIPTKEGYEFRYWEDEYGHTYYPGDLITTAQSSISTMEVTFILNAVWTLQKYYAYFVYKLNGGISPNPSSLSEGSRSRSADFDSLELWNSSPASWRAVYISDIVPYYSDSTFRFAGWEVLDSSGEPLGIVQPSTNFLVPEVALGGKEYILVAQWKEKKKGMAVYIWNNRWTPATPYIYNGSLWEPASALIYTDHWPT